MKKQHAIIIIILLLVFNLLYSVQVFASRAYSPATISPIIYNEIKIVTGNSSETDMGIVKAYDVNTNELIWSKKVYDVKINPKIEKDSQLVFIKEMKIDGDKLVVINESGNKYTLDPNTGKDKENSSTLASNTGKYNFVVNSFIAFFLSIGLVLIYYIIIKKKKIN